MNFRWLMIWIGCSSVALIALALWRMLREPGAERGRSLPANVGIFPVGRWSVEEVLRTLATAPQLELIVRPRTELDRQRLKCVLNQADFHGPLVVEIYLLLRFLAGCAGFFSSSVVQFGIGVGVTNGLANSLIGAVLGFMIPPLYVRWRTKRRQRALTMTLPDALDLMTLAIEVGNGVDVAMQQAGQELKQFAPELHREFERYFAQVNVGRSRRDALHDLALRAGIPEMTSLTAVLIQGHRFGTGISSSLRELSSCMRIRQRQLAEERAQQCAFKLMFPLVLFIFPGVFVVLVGPAAIQIAHDLFSLQ